MKIVLLASGTGTLLQSVIDHVDRSKVHILAVGSDRDCEALSRAQRADIPTFTVEYTPGETDREQWNVALAEQIASYEPDIVVSAGFMRILGKTVVDAFAGQIINTHPALLPAFPGAHGVRDALDYGVKVTGTTVHVVDSGVDTGPIIAQQAVVVEPSDTEATLHERIKVAERQLLIDVLHAISDNGLSINGRKARTTSND
ncbi:phosphoribosylglycinamide formyltransferase [Corynebacterium sp. 320]|uniref:Phosphoribosylglycinamide formyltransferase n=1 Tax=Corynebacterium zhongnanshanii TaxID=2768834 RepID=A0ABQ6VF48_9CORY|nr:MULTISPECIES: phosphoribosylglycinamide formyltransferase [Corynebacterium]KAB1504132.1 phosphoribosylglycinamide formyltransferase [Corynebacterium sp. 320]KAB3523015.1 phosphoribosylglycinamide formyltransferase [Corynebacterium zhongnanshanii]KAB3528268.1 phosphoribosylglycinamide formyltransferase [Corynebacterium sp. 250]MCR5913898.1 phosphoribosylglycinamide formyltransferase [Corynebacterium sp. zg254]QNP91808.1 phosphoribosylglycinamide formyltransferase [Corynebacterium zhongnansha